MILTSIVVASFCFPLFFYKYPFYANRRNLCSVFAVQSINFCFRYIFPIIFLSLLWGLRYDVGTDYLSYKEIYENNFTGTVWESLSESNVEYLYALISHVLYHLGMPYYVMFVIMALIPLIFYYKAFRDKPFLFGYASFFLMALGVLFWYFNIQRQGISFFILLYSVDFIRRKRFFSFLVCIIVAMGFHISSLLFLFCYLFAYLRPTLILNRKFLLLLYLLTWILSYPLQNILLQIISNALVGKYSAYVNIVDSWMMGTGSGIGLLIMHIIDIILIVTSPFLCKVYSNYRYDVYFRIFFVGVLFANIAGLNMVLSRFPFCFVSMRIILMAFLTCYVLKKWNNRNIYFVKIAWLNSVLLSISLLFANIMNTPYRFVSLFN